MTFIRTKHLINLGLSSFVFSICLSSCKSRTERQDSSEVRGLVGGPHIGPSIGYCEMMASARGKEFLTFYRKANVSQNQMPPSEIDMRILISSTIHFGNQSPLKGFNSVVQAKREDWLTNPRRNSERSENLTDDDGTGVPWTNLTREQVKMALNASLNQNFDDLDNPPAIISYHYIIEGENNALIHLYADNNDKPLFASIKRADRPELCVFKSSADTVR
jgi:hypothetical protein